MPRMASDRWVNKKNKSIPIGQGDDERAKQVLKQKLAAQFASTSKGKCKAPVQRKSAHPSRL